MWLKSIKIFKNYSELVCNVLVRTIKNCCDHLEFVSKRFESDQKDNVGGEFEIVYVRARKQSEFNHSRLTVINTNLILPGNHGFYV